MFKRNQAHSEDAADINTLDSLVDDLKLLQDELSGISRNIEKTRDIDQELLDLQSNVSWWQTTMSILKMLIVIGICVGQVYVIT